MPDDLDALLAKIQQEHGPRAIYRPPAIVPAGKWKSGLEARCKDERDDDDTRTIIDSGIDGYAGSYGDRCRSQCAQAEQVEVQRPGSPSLAAEAAPPVPGPVADGERAPEVDPYSPDPRLYSAEEMREFYRRCDEAVAEMQAAMGAGERP